MSLNKVSKTIAKAAQPTEARDEMLTKQELAAKLKIQLRTVESWQQQGYLPFIKVSNVVIFYWPDVVQHLQAHFRVCRGGEASAAGNGSNENHGASAAETKPGRSR